VAPVTFDERPAVADHGRDHAQLDLVDQSGDSV